MAAVLLRNRRREEEGESVFVSMTNLTVSFLFIILILLAFFATQYKPEETVPLDQHEATQSDLSRTRVELSEAVSENQRLKEELYGAHVYIERLEKERRELLDRLNEERLETPSPPDPLATYLESAASTRADLLRRLAEKIQERLPGIRVTVVAADGVIRFRGDDLFASGQWRVQNGSTAERVAHAVADALADTLPCYTVGIRSAFDTTCNSAFATIETIQIEGHTDDTPLSAGLRERERMLDNRDLSARRGAETLRAATDRYRPELMDFRNLEGQPVLSFAGYGAMRPVARGDTPTAKAANRRIDIRFILQTPQNLREVEEIRSRLIDNRPKLPTVEDMRH